MGLLQKLDLATLVIVFLIILRLCVGSSCVFLALLVCRMGREVKVPF